MSEPISNLSPQTTIDVVYNVITDRVNTTFGIIIKPWLIRTIIDGKINQFIKGLDSVSDVSKVVEIATQE
ncbi:hypothetical protein [Vibrio campbellii]|uniref:hypothetical protein n=1 Tax=Vibrio campbellii TaxID=680 RepID=UPI0020CA7FCD|nr:hypothetical protein [Vibrio campbellii]